MNTRSILLACAAATVTARAFDNATAAPKTARVEPALTGVFKIDMPERKNRRGSTSIYSFDSLTEVGMAFGVKNKDAASLSSVVSNANKKARIDETDGAGNVVYETKTLTDPSTGNKTDVPDTTKPRKIATKEFFAVDVDAAMKKKIAGTPLEGSKALVFRSK
jgi:hypothetical protein